MEALLARLRELSLAIPRPGCEWEERPRFDPPASPGEVAAFERAVGFPFPAEVRTFLAITGGVAGMSVHNGYWIGSLERLDPASFPRTAGDEPAAPIATDGGGNAFLVSQGGRVCRWNHETDDILIVANSFMAFVERVADDWAAYVADTPSWRFLI